ncbi:hypothetical protein JYT44_01050, partial [Caldithrix abyssi]|nr:hypothetical protein [Caldithrix abyssi]
AFEKEFGPLYSKQTGRPGKPMRIIGALHYLKHTFDESDESVSLILPIKRSKDDYLLFKR